MRDGPPSHDGDQNAIWYIDTGVRSSMSEMLQERETLLSDWLCNLGAVAAVIRPDRYVYGAASSPEELRRIVRELADEMSPATRGAVIGHCGRIGVEA